MKLAAIFGLWATSASAGCLEPPAQVQDVWIVAVEDPRPYVELGVERMTESQLDWLGMSKEALVEQILEKTPGVVAVVTVLQEVTIEFHRNGRQQFEITSITPWVRVTRRERVWWPHSMSETGPELMVPRRMRLFVQPPCCDVNPATGIPCLVHLSIAMPYPHWLEGQVPEPEY